MILNGKLNALDGKQIAVFPSQDLFITQGANAPYSHFGTRNTDNASASGRKTLYAPCDMKLISKQVNGAYGIVIYHTVEPVYTARSGLTHFTLVLMHMNDTNSLVVNKIYRQGEMIYQEGDADPSGLTTAVHVHYELSLGHQTQRIISVTDGFYHIINPVYIDDIFFKDLTNVIRENAPGVDKGEKTFNFLAWDGETTDPGEPTGSGEGIEILMMANALPNFF